MHHFIYIFCGTQTSHLLLLEDEQKKMFCYNWCKREKQKMFSQAVLGLYNIYTS